MRFLHLFVILIYGTGMAASQEGKPITDLRTVREMPPEQAALGLPVEVEASLIFWDRPMQRCFVHDGDCGLCLVVPSPVAMEELPLGTRIRITGITEAGGFLPAITARAVSSLGRIELPAPILLRSDHLFRPSTDCQWVEVSGRITGINQTTVPPHLEVQYEGWKLTFSLHSAMRIPGKIEDLFQKNVRLLAVAVTDFNLQRQMIGQHFHVPSLECIEPADLVGTPVVPSPGSIAGLYQLSTSPENLVKVTGTVTHHDTTGLYIRGEGGSMFINTSRAEGIQCGQLIEAEGYPALGGYRPHLNATQIRVTGSAAAPLPVAYLEQGTISTFFDSELVELEAEFIAPQDRPNDRKIWVCRSGTRLFEVHFPGWQMEAPLPATILKLVGICTLSTHQPFRSAYSADAITLAVRGPDDVRILRRPSWWTMSRVLRILAIAGAVTLLVISWAITLRRQVRAQTRLISKQLRTEATLEERQRIARELHDTLEQQLAGVAFQLDNVGIRLQLDPPTASGSLRLTQQMLSHCREESRTSIRDLRSVTLEQQGLPGALQEMLQTIAGEYRLTGVFQSQGTALPIPADLEHHLFRIAQEAMINAGKHAGASHLYLDLVYTTEAVVMTVRDDGLGFDTAVAAPRGHFGLVGIHERVAKMRAVCGIQSQPEAGTSIRITVPITLRQTTMLL
jgi:signal transduction histidine kinase